MERRTEIQIALLVAGVMVWGYGQRTAEMWMQYTGMGFFAGAVALRFFKKKPPE